MKYIYLAVVILTMSASAQTIYGPAGEPDPFILTDLDTDSVDTDHLVVNTTAELGATVSTDSAATVTLNSNLVTIGANTGTDVDVALGFDIGATAPSITYNEGGSRFDFSSSGMFYGNVICTSTNYFTNSIGRVLGNEGGGNTTGLVATGASYVNLLINAYGSGGSITLGDGEDVVLGGEGFTHLTLKVGPLAAATIYNSQMCVQETQVVVLHDSVDAAANAMDVLLFDDFPAMYQIQAIYINSTEAWDDGGGSIDGCTISCGWTGAGYDDLIQEQDIYTAVSFIGDHAGEINWTSLQGGIMPSWNATSDIYLRFVADHGNLSTLTTGEMTVTLVYRSY